MAYLIDTGTRTLIFCANPRTGSTAISHALTMMGAQNNGHHTQPVFIPLGALVFQVVRSPLEVINSLWWKSKPTGNFEKFVDLACSGGYEHIRVPMYWRPGINHAIKYEEIQDGFEWVCGMAGLEPPELQRTASRTEKTAKEMFSPHAADKVRETFSQDFSKFGFDNTP